MLWVVPGCPTRSTGYGERRFPGHAGVSHRRCRHEVVCAYPGNPAKGLPNVMATLIYSDPATGYPLAIMDAHGHHGLPHGCYCGIARSTWRGPTLLRWASSGPDNKPNSQLAAPRPSYSRLKRSRYSIISPACCGKVHQVPSRSTPFEACSRAGGSGG